MRRLTPAQARRVALAAQGFPRRPPTGRVDARHLDRVLAATGLLQIDSVNVLVRAHYLPVFSRLGPYPLELLDRYAYRQRRLFEYWGHEASLIPVERRPLFVHRMEGGWHWESVERLGREHPGFVDQVLEMVKQRGPVTAGELDDGGAAPRGTWWDWGKVKLALEWLFLTGKVTVAERVSFTRRYDLPERVFPPAVLAEPAPDADEARSRLLALAARHHGVGTAADLADYYRIRVPAARPLLQGLVRRGELEEVEVEGWRGPVYLHPEAQLPRWVRGRALLSPFDPVVWFRPRTERLFGFHYRIEIYTPAPQRRYGYYVLPFLLDGELVARVDLKAERATGRLLVRTAWGEDGIDRSRVAAELVAELAEMAVWLGLGEVVVEPVGDLAESLARAVG